MLLSILPKMLIITILLGCILGSDAVNISKNNIQIMTGPPFLSRIPNMPRKRNQTMSGQLPIVDRQRALTWKKLNNQDRLQTRQLQALAQMQSKYYQSKYQFDQKNQLPFCVVIPTYNNNNQNRYLRNIRSVAMQNYTNYHIVVIDDASTDGTGALIEEYLGKQDKLPRESYQLRRNQERKGTLHNLKHAAEEMCMGQEIFLVVDGDDQLLGRQVLKLYNSVFQNKDIWFLYSNFIFGDGFAGYSRQLPQKIMEGNTYRGYHFVTSHLRAFYTQLLRNIKQKDLQDENGQFYMAANDVAICLPILQQCHTKVKYIPEVVYFYNNSTGSNNHVMRKKEQRVNQRAIRQKKEYQPLDRLFD